jgi:DNA mismatch repair protein MSH5
MIDLNQVSLALRNTTARSLILLDEFGKGTVSAGSSVFFISLCSSRSFFLTEHCVLLQMSCPVHLLSVDFIDGAGLLCGVLKTLISRGPECPKVLVATHFHELFRQDLLDPDRTPITFLHMEIMFASDDGEVFAVEIDDQMNERVAGVGEKIVYLYRYDILRVTLVAMLII